MVNNSATAVFLPLRELDLSKDLAPCMPGAGTGTVSLSPPVQPVTGYEVSDSCVTGAIYEVAEGTAVTLTAAAGTNSVFDHWEGGASGTANPVNVVVNGNTAVRAVFVPRFTVTVWVEGSGSGIIPDLLGGVRVVFRCVFAGVCQRYNLKAGQSSSRGATGDRQT